MGFMKFEIFCHLLELYTETGESLGEGAFGQVRTYVNNETGNEYAVKVCFIKCLCSTEH